MRARRIARVVAPVTLVAAVAVTSAGVAGAAVAAQAAPGKEVASFIRSEWWPLAQQEVGFPTPALGKVVCPKSVPAVSGDPESTLSDALADLAAGDVAPTIDAASGVFTCVGRLDGQPLLIGGAINEAGGAEFRTASLILDPDRLADSVVDEFADQVGGDADVTCSSRDIIVAQPDVAVRCKVVAADGTKGVSRVVLDGSAQIVSVDFRRK